MATAQQIIALLSSHVQGDQEQVLATALRVAASESRSGRKETAQQLRKLVQEARNAKSRQARPSDTAAIPIARPNGELQTLLSVQ
jgi:hypothetical protein